MSGRILSRVQCRVHGDGMGRVRQTPDGALYEVVGPAIHRFDVGFLKAAGFKGPGRRPPPATEDFRALLSSPGAERFDHDPETWGKLPAWCSRCREWRWVDLDRLRGFEPLVADRIESIMPAEGFTPGRRECHDAQPGRRRVDWVYEEALPHPIVLEVTSIVARSDKKGESAARALAARLTEVAKREGLGSWIVSMDNEHDFRRAEADIVKILRDARPEYEERLRGGGYIRPGWYTDRDLARLPHHLWSAYVAEHERVKGLGVVELTPFQAKQDNTVIVLPTRSGLIGSFSRELSAAITSKAPVLSREQGVERQLGVLVDRWDVSNESQETPVPSIPEQIDFLWIVHRWQQDLDWLPVWVVRRGETAWRIYAAS